MIFTNWSMGVNQGAASGVALYCSLKACFTVVARRPVIMVRWHKDRRLYVEAVMVGDHVLASVADSQEHWFPTVDNC